LKRPVITEYEIKTERQINAPVTIAHISDLHERRSDDILDLLSKTEPDIIVITGDTLERYDNRPQYNFEHKPIKRLIINAMHYTNFLLRKLEGEKNMAKPENAQEFLLRAMKIAPVYMSLGNHEQTLTDEDLQFISDCGLILLDNADTTVTVNGFAFRIGGMSTWDYEDFLSRYAAKDGYKLLLCHHPERFEPLIAETDIDLTLSGHTHGGQMRIGTKGKGFFVPGQGIMGKYAHGMFFGGRLVVSAGCSNTAAFPRIFNPREVVVIRLKGERYGQL